MPAFLLFTLRPISLLHAKSLILAVCLVLAWCLPRLGERFLEGLKPSLHSSLPERIWRWLRSLLQ